MRCGKSRNSLTEKISWNQLFTNVFNKTVAFTKFMSEPHCAQCGKTKNLFPISFVKSTISNFFSKAVTFTKFLSKKCEREFLVSPHCASVGLQNDFESCFVQIYVKFVKSTTFSLINHTVNWLHEISYILKVFCCPYCNFMRPTERVFISWNQRSRKSIQFFFTFVCVIILIFISLTHCFFESLNRKVPRKL